MQVRLIQWTQTLAYSVLNTTSCVARLEKDEQEGVEGKKRHQFRTVLHDQDVKALPVISGLD